jgi:hypothetical protein
MYRCEPVQPNESNTDWEREKALPNPINETFGFAMNSGKVCWLDDLRS